ncbi:RxLR effector protein [Phytophthora megakarya]|uniref:RxLR effector protein n=1 Tax=Phytophthora megakarya TaxID=4795 RepID=A0A225V9X6_9STRA|nr:RxLR effector protein [Phytophthora megakarya]
MDNINARSMQHISGTDLNAVQKKSKLRVRMLKTTDVDDFDERGASPISKIKEPSTSATQKLKKIAVTAKLKVSSKKQKATGNLFKKFNVDKVESNLLDSIQYQNWVNSVNKVYKKNVQEGEVAMMTTLKAHFGDEAMRKLLIEANGFSSTMIKAKKLEEAQFTIWKTNGQSNSWDKYSTTLAKNPENTMLLTLKTHFDDETLAKVLTTAREKSNVASKGRKAEFDNWARSSETSDDVVKLLNLNDDSGNTFKNPGFRTWVTYVIKLDEEKLYDSVLTKLLTRYDEKSLTKKIHAVESDYRVSSISWKLRET